MLSLGTPTVHAQQTDTNPMPAPGTTPTAFDDPDLVKKYQATISESDLAAHLFVFASDYFEGRETATRGQKLAATYLAGQYRKLGLTPMGTADAQHALGPDQYMQPFPVYGKRLSEARIEVKVDGDIVATNSFTPSHQDEHAYLVFGTEPDVEAGVVFGGYGINDDELGYSDFAALEAAGIDYQDKWLLIMRDEPLANTEQSLLKTEDGKPSIWTTQSNHKLRSLFRSGLPKGVLIVQDIGVNAESVAEEAKEAAHDLEGIGQLSLDAESSGRSFPPFYVISKALADQILAPSGRTLEAVKAKIDAEVKPVVFEVEDVMLGSTIENDTFETTSENVLAFIEGSDPELKDEVVVISSHYDHIGIDNGNEEDTINNGADDDGSGTVAILEIAEAFMTAKRDGYAPRRSILFLNVSGEEKGLLGSAYYADREPVIPIENTVANLNIDMIGRYDPSHPAKSENYVYIIGSNLISQELHDINQKVNDLTGVELELDERYNSKDDPNQFYRRSDHWNFGKHSIPFIFFFTGTHDDYHDVGDEAHKIEYPRMTRIAQLIFATAWQVANQEGRPAVSGTGFN